MVEVGKRHVRGAAVALVVLATAVTAPAAAAAPVDRGTRSVASMQVDPVCTSDGDTLRVRMVDSYAVRWTTSSGLSYTTPPYDYPVRHPAPHRAYPLDFAEPAGPTTVTAYDEDGTVVASRTVRVTSCDDWAGRDGYLASGADEIGRPLYLGTVSATPEPWPDGSTSYAGTSGDLWVEPDGTAHAVPGEAARLYRTKGGPSGILGAVRHSTWMQTYRDRWSTGFAGGYIATSGVTGTHSVAAPFLDGSCTTWNLGGPDPYYFPQSTDFPVAEAVGPLRAGGWRQQYEGGTLVERPGSGCLVLWNGPIPDYWAATGYENGPLGYPTELTMSTTSIGFEGGTAFATTRVTPAAPLGVVVLSGEFLTAWRGSTNQPLRTVGTPETFPTRTPDGVGEFVRGSDGSIYRSRATGFHVVSDRTGFRGYWAARGWEAGSLGYPAGEAFPTPRANSFGTTGWGQQFQGGMLYGFDSTLNVLAVRGAILDRWASLGYEQSPLGFPVGDEVGFPGGVRQQFQGGVLTWTAATGQVG